MSLTITCINERFSDAISLEAVAARPMPAATVGYVAEAVESSTTTPLPRLLAALDARVRTTVVPARRKWTIAPHTLGRLTDDEVCIAGKLELTGNADASTATGF